MAAGRPGWVGVRVRHGVGEGRWAQRCSLEGRDPGFRLGRGWLGRGWLPGRRVGEGLERKVNPGAEERPLGEAFLV